MASGPVSPISLRERMSRILASSTVETPRQKLPAPSGQAAKAELDPKPPESFLRGIARETIQRGKQGAAALDIGISEGRLSAKLSDGTLALKDLEALGPEFAVTFAEEVLRQIGPLATPKARAKQLLRDRRRIDEELEQLMEYMA